ncbi:unnamed protein product [Hymenolepis diminuta]|uniref:Uncharacterized protein n=1 Tax=Hymenolepis diminuta TaxID=6216 RepID=A0A564YAZ7_HYMDI|nr:unnamed protein product [Hymenolepis diminuta]
MSAKEQTSSWMTQLRSSRTPVNMVMLKELHNGPGRRIGRKTFQTRNPHSFAAYVAM